MMCSGDKEIPDKLVRKVCFYAGVLTLGNKEEIKTHFHSWVEISKTDCFGVVDASANIDVKNNFFKGKKNEQWFSKSGYLQM